MLAKILMILVFFAITVTVGIWCRKSATDVNSFVLGGRSVGPWHTAFAYGTSYFSAVVFVGYAGQFGWKFGMSATWIGIGNAIIGSLLAWVILGRRTRIMTHHQGGFTKAVIKMSQIPNEIEASAGMQGAYTAMFGPDPLNLLGVVILTSLGTWGLPQMVQKFYAIKSESAISKGTIISTLFAVVVSGGCYFLGGFGRLFQIDTNASGALVYDSVIPNMLSTLSDILIGIVIVLVLSASMSTLSSLVLTSSSTITLDLIRGHIAKNFSEKKQLLCIRIFLVVFIVLSTVIAIFQYRSSSTFIAQLMGISWGALAGAFLAPFLYGLYMKRVSKAAVWTSFIIGVGLTVSNMFLKFIASPINAGAIAMVLGLIAVPLVSLITPAPKNVDVEKMFRCYREKVVVEKKGAITEDSVK